MRRLLLPLLALLLGGCLETKETIRLFHDGTGKLLQVTTLDLEQQDDLVKAFLALYGKKSVEGERTLADPTAPSWLRSLARRTPGYDINLLEAEEEDGRRRMTLSGTFGELRAAARAGAFPGTAVSLERKGSKAWRLTFRQGWGLVGDVSRNEVGGRPVAKLIEHLAKGFAGWSLQRAVVFPARVLETNGELDEDGVTVKWRLTLDDLTGQAEVEHWARFEEREGLELRPFQVGPRPRLLLRRLVGRPPRSASRAK